MCAESDIWSRKSDKLSKARVPKNEFVSVSRYIFGKANQAVASTDDIEYSVNAFTMEREVKVGVFVEIFIVVPIQFVEFLFVFVDFKVSSCFGELF